MALTEFQRGICRLLAQARIERGESYVAGGVALNALIDSPRVSRDVDLFHDSDEALAVSWTADRTLLEASGCSVTAIRERPGLVEADVARGTDMVLIQWARDSAYRFFPLIQHADLGLTLHPFDLATNKVLALVGRVEARDWVDVIECDERIQPLGYLAWSACGKDPGLNPGMILDEARRTARYSANEIAALAFAGLPPGFISLAAKWREMLKAAGEVISALPAVASGTCVLDAELRLYTGGPSELKGAIERRGLCFHAGSMGGSFPQIIERPR